MFGKNKSIWNAAATQAKHCWNCFMMEYDLLNHRKQNWRETKTDESAMQCLCGSEARTSLTDNQVNWILKRNLNSKHITPVHTPFRRCTSVCVFRASWKGLYNHTYRINTHVFHIFLRWTYHVARSPHSTNRSGTEPRWKQLIFFIYLCKWVDR